MNFRRRYRIIIEDEAHLRTVVSKQLSSLQIWCASFLACIFFIFLAFILIRWTPLRGFIPAYLPESQRIESNAALIRIDSLSRALEQNKAWIDNFTRVTDTRSRTSDSLRYATVTGVYSPDSLPDASPAEARFVAGMEERERFNISVLAPLDADGMTISPISGQSVVTSASRQNPEASVIVASRSPIQSLADGTVLAIYNNPGHGYTLLIQHGRGFVSSYAHLGSLLVNVGESVNSGQAIAFPPAPNARGASWIKLRIWHNGTPLLPSDILP